MIITIKLIGDNKITSNTIYRIKGLEYLCGKSQSCGISVPLGDINIGDKP